MSNADFNLSKLNIKIYQTGPGFYCDTSDMIADNLEVKLIDELGKIIQSNEILQGSTLSIMDLTAVNNGGLFCENRKCKRY